MSTILVIEDASGVREGTAEILSFEGYDVIEAQDGRTGLDMALEKLPDVIVCDIMMPGLTGYDVLRKLRGEPSTATIPFVFLTAKASKEDVREGLAAGADDYITKPFTVEELVDVVKKRLRRKNLEELLKMPMEDLPREKRSLAQEVWTIALFADIERNERERLLKYAFAEEFEAGTVLFHEGSIVGHHMYVVLSGEVEILKKNKRGNQVPIAALHRGQFLGEMSLFEEEKRSATARVKSPSRLLVITRPNFELMTRSDPEIAIKIMRVFIRTFCERLRSTSDGYAALARE